MYLAANSGARVGVANEVRDAIKISWVSEDDPTKGFNYLYLEDVDMQKALPSGGTLANSVRRSVYSHVHAWMTWDLGCKGERGRGAFGMVLPPGTGSLTVSRLQHGVHGASHAHASVPARPCLLARSSVLVTPSGERRHVISDIIGAEDGLGVENLSGSGAIASLFCRAFRDGFTITLVRWA